MKKGHDYIGNSVIFFCHDGAGRFLMAKRGRNARDENGRWEIGGGGIEFGETAEEALRREIREKYGAEPQTYEFLGYMDVHREQEGRRTHWIALAFKAHVHADEVSNAEPDICDEIGWFTLNTLPEDLHSQFPNFLERFRGKLTP